MSDVDDLAEAYCLQVEALIEKEAQKRITEAHDPDELARLRGLSLLSLVSSDDPDLVPLGPVRAALDGHGGGLLIAACDVKRMHSGAEALSLVIDLDGACVSCGAAPGTLRGIQDDLLMDEEVVTVRFAAAMLQWFDELQREFVLKHGGVTFVEV